VGRILASRPGHPLRGEDPDDDRRLCTEIERELEHALAVVTGENERAAESELGSGLEWERTETLGMELVCAAQALGEAALFAGAGDELATRLMSAASLVAAKAARLAVEREDSAAGAELSVDAASTLLLIEHAGHDLDDAAGQLAPLVVPAFRTRLAAAHSALSRWLEPFRGAISHETRAGLAALRAAGCAPSPFCTVADHPPGAPS
jgi:hypothetical protein